MLLLLTLKGKHTCTPYKETGAQASSLLSQKDKVSPSKHKKLTINMHDKSRYMHDKSRYMHDKSRNGVFKAYRIRGFMIKKSYRYIIDISRKAPCRAWAFLEEKKKYIFVEFSFGYSIKDGFQAFPFGDKVLTTLSPAQLWLILLGHQCTPGELVIRV